MDGENTIDLSDMFFYRIDTRTLSPLNKSNVFILNCKTTVFASEEPDPFETWVDEQKMIKVGGKIYQDLYRPYTQHTVNEITMEEYKVYMVALQENLNSDEEENQN